LAQFAQVKKEEITEGNIARSASLLSWLNYVADDFVCPLTTQITLFYTVGVVFRVVETGEGRNFKFNIDVNHKKSYRTDDK